MVHSGTGRTPGRERERGSEWKEVEEGGNSYLAPSVFRRRHTLLISFGKLGYCTQNMHIIGISTAQHTQTLECLAEGCVKAWDDTTSTNLVEGSIKPSGLITKGVLVTATPQ